MKKMMTVVLMAIIPAGSLLAHHSLGNLDTTKAVRVKGTVLEFRQINPHSFIFLNQTDPDGVSRRWAVEGPSTIQLQRMGIAVDALKPGVVIEACGYLPKEATMWQIASPTGVSLAGRLLTGEVLVMPDGREQSWGDYGFHKCFADGFRDQHSK